MSISKKSAKDKKIGVRLTDAERQIINYLADRNNMKKGEYIRTILCNDNTLTIHSMKDIDTIIHKIPEQYLDDRKLSAWIKKYTFFDSPDQYKELRRKKTKTSEISVRLTKSDYDYIMGMSEEKEMKLSQYIQNRLFEYSFMPMVVLINLQEISNYIKLTFNDEIIQEEVKLLWQKIL